MTIAPQDVAAHFEYVGQAEASKHIVVRANVTGVIVERPYVEGTDVPQGALLFRIDPTTYKAAYDNAIGTLEDARARLANAKITLNRDVPLLAERAVAQQDVDNAQAQVHQDSADVIAAQGTVDKTKKDLDDTQVRAQVAGRVGIAWMVLGSRVTGPGDSLTSLDQVDPVYVRFNPSDQDVLQWRREVAEKRLRLPDGKLRVRVALSDGSVFPQPGIVNFADIAQFIDRDPDAAGDFPEPATHYAAGPVRPRLAARFRAPRGDSRAAAGRATGHHRPVRLRRR